MARWFITLFVLSLLPVLTTEVLAQSRGIGGRPAPAWQVDEWFNLPEGSQDLDVSDLQGKVIYLYGFQSWCPGCHSRGFPTLKALIEKYKGNDKVAFVAVQTVFEGYTTNTPAKAKSTGERYELDIPIGHSGRPGKPSRLMRSYRTGGTPWTIIIDRNGIVRYNDFHISPAQGKEVIDALLLEPVKAKESVEIETLPADRGGQDLIGKKFPSLKPDRWARQGTSITKKPKATLYRWWTDACPWCEASLPAIETLRKKYGKAGLRTVAVYHPKPPHPETDEVILAAAKKFKYGGDVAVDLDWSELKRAYLASGDRGATSVSILVDEDGIIRFVHPGPVFHPTKDPEQSQRNQDYLLVEQAIRLLVSEPSN
ncbi:MAG: redoxin family protein [Phycisphaerales bacterium]|nr:redoxin family protein [Phycisphaerales bacterium]